MGTCICIPASKAEASISAIELNCSALKLLAFSISALSSVTAKGSDTRTPVHFARREKTAQSSAGSSSCSWIACGDHFVIASIKPCKKLRKHPKSCVRKSCARRVTDLHVHACLGPCSTSISSVIAAKDRRVNELAQVAGARRVHSSQSSTR